jgi:Ca2+-binding EF-hand superfamily protein
MHHLTSQDFDVNGDGVIGAEDLIVIFRKLGDYEITKEEIEQMLVDATGDRKRMKATFEEFKAVSKGF